MNNNNAVRATVARRVSIWSSAAIAVLLIVICGALSWVLTNQAQQRTLDYMSAEASSVARVADALDRTARDSANRLYDVLAGDFAGGAFTLEGDGELAFNGQKLNGNFDAVDRFTRLTGGNATIFARKGTDDFIRITTSVKKEDGSRAVGTTLDRAGAAYAKLAAGETYVGPATLFKVPYMTRYSPIKDAGGKVVGILYIGFDMRGLHQELVKMADAVKLYGSGGLYLLDPGKTPADALLRAHPRAQGKKLSELMPADQAERYVKTVTEDADGVLEEVQAVYGDSYQDAFAVARKSQATGWWVIAEASRAQALAAHNTTLWVLWGLMLATVVLLGLGVTWMLGRWVGQPLADLNEAVGAVANGDLTRPVLVRQQDDLGALAAGVERMRLQLSRTINEVRQASDSIGTASAEVAAGSRDLSSRTEQSASHLQETASALEELASSMSQTAASAAQAHQLVGESDRAAQRGGNVVAQVVTTMDEISTASRQIGDIIGTIDSIAFQTNILALNAAVEAARAGEQGRGFAVVAAEVRQLAQRSAEAAKQIKALITASGERVESGAKLVGDTGEAMRDIVASVKRVTDIIGEISTAAREQSQGVTRINGAVAQLDQGTQQNAALVEESTAAAESLREQAHRLVEQVGQFRV
ncbi:methyl-accepting chemotaxis protein-2 (aspartate sensor receptor) [Mitsuaria sp. BK045]|uniref:Cache 3/Cache 2 fusion domain-containing protein n=1 Tax=unclassified Roseateles TaxID=2626991 RepID=UPI0016209113|nr:MULTISPECIES: Cache 3/Cache 2 fusion domain-containing protein [unclassified Roseateles]MBB3294807.1 methyl-accepting chemotaxis protein-2 (aspartate sensor receptor) [Mitsuaria sp. BK041]MBB3364023.1 methyl-accepting chemotaxis protein-2 (aspartate sensor receptor) [Mitsuaria sp. BK045]